MQGKNFGQKLIMALALVVAIPSFANPDELEADHYGYECSADKSRDDKVKIKQIAGESAQLTQGEGESKIVWTITIGEDGESINVNAINAQGKKLGKVASKRSDNLSVEFSDSVRISCNRVYYATLVRNLDDEFLNKKHYELLAGRKKGTREAFADNLEQLLWDAVLNGYLEKGSSTHRILREFIFSLRPLEE